MSVLQANNVTARIQYLANNHDLAVYNASVAGGEIIPHQGYYIMQPVTIHDGRASGIQYELDEHGFKLCNQPSAVSDFDNEYKIIDVYYPEIKQLVIRQTGANHIEIFDHTRRATSAELRKQKTLREPANIVHNDYTAKSGHVRLRDYLSDHPEKQNELENREFAIINVWRSTAGTVENYPLAICDASSVRQQDLVSVVRESSIRKGEIQLAVHHDSHCWTWFPEMTQDELILLKTFESVDDERARFTIHTSFNHPHAPTNAASRESIEVRCFVFWN